MRPGRHDGVCGANWRQNLASVNIPGEFDELAAENISAWDTIAAKSEYKGLSIKCEQYPMARTKPPHPTTGSARNFPCESRTDEADRLRSIDTSGAISQRLTLRPKAGKLRRISNLVMAEHFKVIAECTPGYPESILKAGTCRKAERIVAKIGPPSVLWATHIHSFLYLSIRTHGGFVRNRSSHSLHQSFLKNNQSYSACGHQPRSHDTAIHSCAACSPFLACIKGFEALQSRTGQPLSLGILSTPTILSHRSKLEGREQERCNVV